MGSLFKSMSKHFLLLLTMITSLISVYLCCKCSFPNGYENLWFLPCSYFIFSLVYYRVISKGNLLMDIPTIAFILLLFIRNSVTPLVMTQFGVRSSLGVVTGDNVRFAIWLIVYETIIIYTYVIIKKTGRIKFRFGNRHALSNRNLSYTVTKNRNNQMFLLVFWGTLFICIATIALVPEIRTQYYSIFTSNITNLYQETANYTSGTFLRVLSTGGEILIEAMRIILPAVVIFQIRKKRESAFGLIVSFFVVFCQVLWMNDSNAYILMVMISEVIFIYRLYPKYASRTFRFGIIIGTAFIVLLMINRFALDHYSGAPALWLQSYFPSVSNATGIKSLAKEHDFLQIFSDCFVAIPFKSFFGYSGNVQSTATLWNAANGIKGQIVPNVAVGYYYFGFILAPLLSIISIGVSYKLFGKMKITDNPIQYAAYAYFMLYSIIMPFTYNWTIYIQCFTNRVIFIFIIAWLSNYSFHDIKKLEGYSSI